MEGQLGTFALARQFWSHQLVIGAASVGATVAAVAWAGDTVRTIPQSGFEAISGGIATLLGLTFTAFSILTTFMPNLRADFVKSHTFATMGETFVLTMGAQIAAFTLAAVCFVFYEPSTLDVLAPFTIALSLFSVGLMAELIAYMFSLFKMARHALSRSN